MADGDLLNMVRPAEPDALPNADEVRAFDMLLAGSTPAQRSVLLDRVLATPEGSRARLLWTIGGAVGGAFVGGLAVYFLRK